MNQDEIIYDWNVRGNKHSPPLRKIELFDETLRDGIQCPSISDPPIEKKLEILRLLDKLGVHEADIALPGAGKRAIEDCTIMVEMIRDEGLNIKPAAAARTATAAGFCRYCVRRVQRTRPVRMVSRQAPSAALGFPQEGALS